MGAAFRRLRSLENRQPSIFAWLLPCWSSHANQWPQSSRRCRSRSLDIWCCVFFLMLAACFGQVYRFLPLILFTLAARRFRGGLSGLSEIH